MSDTELGVSPVVEPATPEPVPADPTPFEPLAVVEPVPVAFEPEPQPVDATGQLIPTPEPDVYPDATPAEIEASLTPPTSEPEPEPEEFVNPGLALAAPAYVPPAADFEHTAFNPDNVQHIT
jgi:hypothetical protein